MNQLKGQVDGSSGILVTDPIAVSGDTEGGFGVCGLSGESNGVAGFSLLQCGVFGSGHATGMHAVGVVRGLIAEAGATAVSEGSAAIEATSTLGTGVYANSRTGAGVYAYSDQSRAIYATSGSSDAVYGFAQGSGTGVIGQSVKGLAGSFVGPVQISGSLVVFGAKSAAVKHRDGAYRTFYAQESPESWLEDFGESALTKGAVTVPIDREFGRCVSAQPIHIFLTPTGECNGIYVARKNARSFTVRELLKGKSNATFSYRIVAKRRDVKAPRLAKVAFSGIEKMPSRPTPTEPSKRPAYLIKAGRRADK